MCGSVTAISNEKPPSERELGPVLVRLISRVLLDEGEFANTFPAAMIVSALAGAELSTATAAIIMNRRRNHDRMFGRFISRMLRSPKFVHLSACFFCPIIKSNVCRFAPALG